MKNFTKLLGIIALVAIIGFSFAACSSGGGDDSSSSSSSSSSSGGNGVLTITGILPELNGMYAYIEGAGDVYKGAIIGAVECNGPLIISSPRASGGSVTIPLWLYTIGKSDTPRYSGNGTFSAVTVRFSSTNEPGKVLPNRGQFIINSVTFSNGSATIPWSSGQYYSN